jgi:hypothetical protein
MIFQFEINFWYDLRSPEFKIQETAEDRFVITMPQCLYAIAIKDISFYDEQSAKLLNWLLPPLVGKAFSKNFSEEDKNKLKDEAKMQAASMADELIKRLSSEIEKSARQTMEMLSKSFGAKSVVGERHIRCLGSGVRARAYHSLALLLPSTYTFSLVDCSIRPVYSRSSGLAQT